MDGVNAEEIQQLQLEYPFLLFKETVDKVCMRGPVDINEETFNILLIIPKSNSLKDCLKDFKLHVMDFHNVKTFTKLSCSKYKSEWMINDLIAFIPQLIKETVINNILIKPVIDMSSPPQTNIYEQLAAIYNPNTYRIQFNADFTILRFDQFSQYEKHYLELNVPKLNVRKHSLPDGMIQWQKVLENNKLISTIVDAFMKFLENLLPFYSNLNAIDELCYVVQPTNVTVKHNWRVFLYNDRVFLKLSITNPLTPVASKILKIFGPTVEVENLRRIYADGLKHWDIELDILNNLLRIFELCFFPMRPTNNIERSAEHNCHICLCYSLDADDIENTDNENDNDDADHGGDVNKSNSSGEIPMVSCDNPNCSTIYHGTCLKNWFKSLSEGKNFLEISFGACPYCKTQLSTDFNELM